MRDNLKILCKAIALLLILVCAFFILRHEAVRPYLTAEALQSFVNGVGPWGPVAFVLIFAILAALPFPGSLLVIAGGAIFGFWWGLGLTFIGSMLASSLAFALARTLGRDFARKVAGATLRRYDDRLSKDGFHTILYLRLLLVPFAPVNYTAGLSGVRFRDYIAATAIGTIPSILFLLFFVATVRDVILEYGIVSRELLYALVRWDVLLATGLLLACFAIPHVVRLYSHKK